MTPASDYGKMAAPQTMNHVRCPECLSLNVTIVDADQSRGVVAIQCFECGQETEVDAEAFKVDTGDLPEE